MIEQASWPLNIDTRLTLLQEDFVSPGLATPDAAKNEHTGIYSSSGFDILGVLVSVFDLNRAA